jgi:GlpG protein
MYKIVEVALQEDLSQFSRLLWQKKITHRIVRLEESQVLTVPSREAILPATRLFEQWHRGEIHPGAEDGADFSAYFQPAESVRRFLKAFFRAPVTLSLIVVCLVMALAAPLGDMNSLARALLFPDFSFGTRIIDLERVLENFTVIHLLRMVSPVLLHDGIIHLAFNMLWLWEFGRRIEAAQPSWMMLPLVLAIALVSNTAQYLYAGTFYFGGMSGVVYGLFGYIWMWQLFFPQKRLGLPPGLIVALLALLAIMSFINLERVADTAHLGGLLAGVVYGAFTATIGRIRYKV